MTDHELLKKAAKTAGIEYKEYHVLGLYTPKRPAAYWNPLTNDGDALRLAVKLGLWINAYEYSVEAVKPPQRDDETSVSAEEGYAKHNDDPYAATRRCIVRAAAEIGEKLQCQPQS